MMFNVQPDFRNFLVFGAVNTVTYKNYKGEEAERRIIPLQMRFGVSQEHTEPQWLIECIACDRMHDGGYRTFALSGIKPRTT